MEVWEKFGGKYASFFLTLVVCIEIHISAHPQNFLPDVDDSWQWRRLKRKQVGIGYMNPNWPCFFI